MSTGSTSLDADSSPSAMSLDADSSLDEALAALAAAGVGRLPVVSDGEIVGAITRHELRRSREFEQLSGASLEELNYEVSPNDCMFDGRMAVYLGGGLDSLDGISRGLAGRSPESILDFGCGHGRVLRFLKLAFPEARLTASDIDEDAVQFCRDRLGVPAFLSAEDPREIPDPGGPFDLIWVGSMFTHIDADRWRLFMRFFESLLAQEGTLVFTIQGPSAAERLRSGIVDLSLGRESTERLLADFKDFSYVDYPGQHNYGISLSTIEWVKQLIASETALAVTDYHEQGWGGHQDGVTARRANTGASR